MKVRVGRIRVRRRRLKLIDERLRAKRLILEKIDVNEVVKLIREDGGSGWPS